MMAQSELFYAIPTALLALGLLALALGMIALGGRIGRQRAKLLPKGEGSQVSALRASLLGLLALLVGFSFSLAMERYNDRSAAVVTEANAIGTAWLRTDLLEGADREALRGALADFAASRLRASDLTLYQAETLGLEAQKTDAAFAAAWKIASDAARKMPNPATMAVAAALNDMTDSYASHEAAMHRHVPGIVLALLAVTLAFLAWVVGFASGEAQERTPAPMLMMVGLIVLLLSLILDLDRPRRGLIHVDQTAMITAATHILAEAGRAPTSSN